MDTRAANAGGCSRWISLMKPRPLPSRERLLSRVDYNPGTGEFRWKERPNGHATGFNSRFAGEPALIKQHPRGYLCGVIDGQGVLAHRVAWKITHDTDPEYIDHINGDKTDNRIENLRSVSTLENNRNQFQYVTNTSGFRGVRFEKRRKHWKAEICLLGKSKYLGSFCTMEAAAAARLAAEAKYGFHPNHGRTRAANRRAKQDQITEKLRAEVTA